MWRGPRQPAVALSPWTAQDNILDANPSTDWSQTAVPSLWSTLSALWIFHSLSLSSHFVANFFHHHCFTKLSLWVFTNHETFSHCELEASRLKKTRNFSCLRCKVLQDNGAIVNVFVANQHFRDCFGNRSEESEKIPPVQRVHLHPSGDAWGRIQILRVCFASLMCCCYCNYSINAALRLTLSALTVIMWR